MALIDFTWVKDEETGTDSLVETYALAVGAVLDKHEARYNIFLPGGAVSSVPKEAFEQNSERARKIRDERKRRKLLESVSLSSADPAVTVEEELRAVRQEIHLLRELVLSLVTRDVALQADHEDSPTLAAANVSRLRNGGG